jgi:hypothetical protein
MKVTRQFFKKIVILLILLFVLSITLIYLNTLQNSNSQKTPNLQTIVESIKQASKAKYPSSFMINCQSTDFDADKSIWLNLSCSFYIPESSKIFLSNYVVDKPVINISNAMEVQNIYEPEAYDFTFFENSFVERKLFDFVLENYSENVMRRRLFWGEEILAKYNTISTVGLESVSIDTNGEILNKVVYFDLDKDNE